MAVYETAGAMWYRSYDFPWALVIADGCLDSQVEDSWLFS
jgi:hypothetical protein